jgi:hypothetical protein
MLEPKVARELLALNDPRRTAACNLDLIDCYAQQMRSGEWRFTGDTIKVNKSGGLMDGQHRLQAVIRSGWSGMQLVVTGIADSAAWAMDPPGKQAAA